MAKRAAGLPPAGSSQVVGGRARCPARRALGGPAVQLPLAEGDVVESVEPKFGRRLTKELMLLPPAAGQRSIRGRPCPARWGFSGN